MHITHTYIYVVGTHVRMGTLTQWVDRADHCTCWTVIRQSSNASNTWMDCIDRVNDSFM